MVGLELNMGILTPVKIIKNHQEFIDFVHEHKLTEQYDQSIESYLAHSNIEDVTTHLLPIILVESGDSEDSEDNLSYCFYKQSVYKFDKYVMKRGDNYINAWNKNSDGSFNFTSLFYEWSTDFNEMLRAILSEISENQ